jgi:hypothetical protein
MAASWSWWFPNGDRIVAAYFFSISLPVRVHIIRCETGVTNYAALEA